MSTASRPIFLVGCPRSGTTLLSVMLHAHPRIAMPPETRFLLPTYYTRSRFGDLTVEENRRALGRAMTQRGSQFADLGLKRKDVVAKIAAGPPTFGSAAGTIWREFARSRGKARWGEKRPAYWQSMDVILRLFPDAQVIHLVRDGRSCVASLKQVTWWPDGVMGGMATWVLADQRLRRLGKELGADSYYRIQYEDLLADPRAELERLCDYLGEEFDDAMLDHPQAASDIVPSRAHWHDRTRGPVDPGRIDAWRSVLTPEEVGLFEWVAGRALRANGYSPDSGAGTRPRPRDVAAYGIAYAKMLAIIYRNRALDIRQRYHDKGPLADLG
jgi:hypothetical protein